MPALFESPPIYDLPFTKGDDLSVRFVYKEPLVDTKGNPVMDSGRRRFAVADYPAGVEVVVEVDVKPTQLVFTADVAGSDAVIHEEFSVVDAIPRGVAWRVKLIYADGLTKVAAYGKTVRND
jgi:hypothetical protein